MVRTKSELTYNNILDNIIIILCYKYNQYGIISNMYMNSCVNNNYSNHDIITLINFFLEIYFSVV